MNRLVRGPGHAGRRLDQGLHPQGPSAPVSFGTVEQASNMGAAAVGATIYFGSEHSTRQITEVAEAFAYAHELGMATILWWVPRGLMSSMAA